MKRIFFTTVLIMCTVLFCAAQHNSTSTYSDNDDDGQRRHSIKIHDDNGDLEIKCSGDISFNENETAIKNISPDGFIRYKKNGKSIAATSEKNGAVMYEVNGADKKSSLTEDETAFLTTAIKTMIEYGIGAKDRVERIYKKSGSQAVLSEVHNMKSDYVKSIYLGYLLETNSLTNDEMMQIAGDVKTMIGSDFEKGKLLGKFSEKYLSNAFTSQAYLGAIKSIGSDFEKANALKAILKQPLNPAQFTEVLSLTGSIGSDFEKANVMKEVLDNNKISPDHFSEVLKATAGIGSDFEKANVLKKILENNNLPENQFNETMSVISSVGSDFEKANILKEVVKNKLQNETQWLSLINTSEKVLSDFEKGNVLVSIAARMPSSENIKSAYMKAAKTISSDNEYGRVVRAIR